MSILPAFLLFAVGLLLLVKGADWLVEGASTVARQLRVSDLVVGLTIVAFGTSTPELIVNILASLKGNSDIAIGNIVGSNIANILLILGITALLTPLTVQRSTVIKEIPFSLLAAAALLVMANDALLDGYAFSELGKSDGIVLLGFFAIFLYYTFGISKEGPIVQEHAAKEDMTLCRALLMVIVGLAALILGGKLCVENAQKIALGMGVSEGLVGLTVVAIGTSLPELFTSVVAALKKKPDIAVGNIVGSNIFNIFLILGVSSIIKPLPFRPEFNVDLMMVVLSSLLIFFAVHSGFVHRRVLLWWQQKRDYFLNRIEGIVLLGSYVAYIVLVALRG